MIKHLIIKYVPPRFIELITPKGISETAIPKNKHSVVSDLFCFKNYDSWETFFELINFSEILEPRKSLAYNVDLYFFNHFGKKIFKIKILNEPFKKQKLNLNKLLPKNLNLKYGTFAVCHNYIDKTYLKNNSYLSESGYCSYQKIGYPMSNFVHGNIDAISINKGSVKALSSRSFSIKKYFVQHPLNTLNKDYEIFIVNSSSKSLKFKIYETDLYSNNKTSIVSIKSKGCYLHVPSIKSKIVQLVIESKLFMARPLIFEKDSNYFDVFHG